MTSWENLAVAAAELAATPVAEARIRAAFAGADEDWKRSAALSFGAVAGQRAAEAVLVLATIGLRLVAHGIYARSDAAELERVAMRLREHAAAAAALAQQRLERGQNMPPPGTGTPDSVPPLPAPDRNGRIISFPDGK